MYGRCGNMEDNESSKYGIFIQKWSWELPKKERKEVVATEYGG